MVRRILRALSKGVDVDISIGSLETDGDITDTDGEKIYDKNNKTIESDVDNESVDTGHVWLGQQSDTPTDSEIGAGNVALYAKDDGNIYKKENGGSETQIGSGSGIFSDGDSDTVYEQSTGSGIDVPAIFVDGSRIYFSDTEPTGASVGDYWIGGSPGGGASYPSSVVSAWQLEETSGTTASDSVGGNDATIQGTVTQGVSGARGSGYSFEGGYLDVGDGVFNVSQGTVVAWIEIDDTNSKHTIFGQDVDGSNTSGDTRFYVDDGTDATAGDIALKQQDGGNTYTAIGQNLSASTQYKVAVTFGSGVELYVDDTEQTTGDTAHNVGMTSTGAPTNIAAWGDGSDSFGGDISEIVVADEILTQSEISNL